MITLRWVKAPNGNWFSLENLNLECLGDVSGVYIIWHRGDHPEWVRVGQGGIRDKLAMHRQDKGILAYHRQGLFVSWAAVSPRERDGVERYLVELCQPLLGERPPTLIPSASTYPPPWCSGVLGLPPAERRDLILGIHFPCRKVMA